MAKKRGLRSLIMVPVYVFAAGVLLSYLGATFMQYNYMYKYADSLLRGKVVALDNTFKFLESTLDRSMDQINYEFDELYEAIRQHDDAELLKQMDWAQKTSGMLAYILTDLDGEVLSSSASNIRTKELEKLIENVKSNGRAKGLARIMGANSYWVVVDKVVASDGEDLGYCVMILNAITDDQFVGNFHQRLGVDVFMFSGQHCVSGTNDKIERVIYLPTEGMDTVYTALNKYYYDANLNGDNYLACAIPVKDFSGNSDVAIAVIMELSDIMEGANAMLVYSVVFALWAFFTVWLVRKLINKRAVLPVQRLLAQVNVVAQGDLTQPIEIQDDCGEITQLAHGALDMQQRIRQTIAPIVELTQVSVGSVHQLASASLNMSNTANRQAASLEEISSSMEEMGANVQQNTENSIETNKIAQGIQALLAKLGDSSQKSYDAIQNIAQDVNAINELVSQTNILALNASVEAARAGEQGKGFAVVAKEVGRLADQTRETSDGINVTASQSIVESEVAFKEVSELLPRIQEVVDLVKNITTASVEQNSGVEQINSAIVDLNNVTQQNAASAEELAASTQELERMLHDILNAVNVFKL